MYLKTAGTLFQYISHMKILIVPECMCHYCAKRARFQVMLLSTIDT